MTTPYTQPGTVNLSERLPDHPVHRAVIATARAKCDVNGHPPGCHNSWSDTTYCRCGFVQYSGDCAPSPESRHIELRGKFDDQSIY
jgi:hypothetical protein